MRVLKLILIISSILGPFYPSDTFAHEPFTLVREPDPFRRDDEQINGRNFEYTTTGFLNRFSYRFRPGWNNAWLDDPEGYRITAGSVRSRDLYVVHFLNKSIQFDETFTGHIRHRKDEDFDGRYDRTLVGMSVAIGDGWSIGALGDIVATKEDIDIQIELSWKGDPGNRFRLAFVAVDHFFNEKQDDLHYRKKPYTLFAEAHRKLSNGTRIGGSVNWNPKLELVNEDEGRNFQYHQFFVETYAGIPLTNTLGLILSAKGEVGKRKNMFNTHENRSDSVFNRDNVYLDAQGTYSINPSLSSWIGARYFFLNERNSLIQEDNTITVRRAEPMIHAGIEWNIAERWAFWPGLYLTAIDDLDQSLDRKEEREKSLHTRLTFPLEYAFSEFAHGTINPTLRAPGGPFGGLNIQFQILF
jgi:hypothetical protein